MKNGVVGQNRNMEMRRLEEERSVWLEMNLRLCLRRSVADGMTHCVERHIKGVRHAQ